MAGTIKVTTDQSDGTLSLPFDKPVTITIAVSPETAPPPTPEPAPPPVVTADVSTIADLKAALRDDGNDVIVVRDGSYTVAPATTQRATSLWIGADHATRTRDVLVRAQTPGAVGFTTNGATCGAIAFEDGAHHQTWEGFSFGGGPATSTGVIIFGGWADAPAPHHITLRGCAIPRTATGGGGVRPWVAKDHAIYVSMAKDGPHHLLFEDMTGDGSGGLASFLHNDHSAPGSPNGHDIIARRIKAKDFQQTIIHWEATAKDWLYEDWTITASKRFAARVENTAAASNIVFRRVVSTGTAEQGFYSSKGTPPPGVTLDACSFA